MAFDAFLKIEGIDGESQDKTHKGEIEIDSYSWGVEQTGTGVGGGGGTGRASAQDFHFTTKLSKASPILMLSCANGKHFSEATITCRKAGGDKGLEFLKIKLQDLLVSSYAPGGSAGDDFPTESFSLNFAKVEFMYTVQKTGEVVETSFDFGIKGD